MKTTITEALQELKTIQKRLASRRENLMPFIARDSRVKDPLEKEGGCIEHIKRERQGIADLETRFVRIRHAIQEANLTTLLTLGNKTQSVTDWMNWRRELSSAHKDFVVKIARGIQGLRAEITKKGFKMVSSEAEAGPSDIIVHLDEKALLSEQDELEKLLGELDGKLSLLNATMVIDI